MGEVYRARDTKLDRDVALKVLPSEMAADPERLARFEREAKAIAALDHPNIVTIFSVEKAAGETGPTGDEVGVGHGEPIHFITMQLVEGTTLSGLIPRQGLPLERFFELAIPLADAVSTAHEHGIVHRDLKPANVMVSKDGRVKVLDFGLAKLREESPHAGGALFGRSQGIVAPDAPTSGPTTTPPPGPMSPDAATAMATAHAKSSGSASPLTEEGKILGTVAYMSPEQAEGKLVDQRTDVFSLGIILYQMATGETPFKGDTNLSILSAIMKDTPSPVTESHANLPRHLGRIIKHSLEKDPERRFQSAKDLRNELAELSDEVSSGETLPVGMSPGSPPTSGRHHLRWGLGGLAAGAVVAALALWGWSSWLSAPATAGDPVSFFEEVPADGQTINTYHVLLDLSPSGRQLAYLTDAGIRVRDLGEPDSILLEGTEGASSPFFSPDGEWIGFLGRDGINRIPVQGGPVLPMTRSSSLSWGADWWEDWIYYSDGTLWRTSVRGGEPEPVIDTSAMWPQVLPGGREVLITELGPSGDWSDARVVIHEIEGPNQWIVAEEATFGRYLEDGFILVVLASGAVVAQPYDIELHQARGTATGVLSDVRLNGWGGAAQFAVSSAGTVAFIDGGRIGDSFIRIVDRSGDVVADVGEPASLGSLLTLSPDGKQCAVVLRGLSDDVYVIDLESGPWRRLSFEVGENETPVWSPDGSTVVYTGTREGRRHLLARAADGRDRERILYSSDRYLNDARNHTHVWDWSPANDMIIFSEGDQLWGLPAGESQPELILQDPGGLPWRATVSPDGRWIAVEGVVSGRREIFVRAYDGSGGPMQISTDGGQSPRWSTTGDELFFRASGWIMSTPLEREPSFRWQEPRPLFESSAAVFDYDPATDRFVLREWNPEAYVRRIQIVVNWAQNLRGGP